MEELRPEELEELVQELAEASSAEEAPFLEVEKLLRDLQSSSASTRLEAAHQLGSLDISSPRIVQALIAAQESDSSSTVRWYAADALRADVHQSVLEQHPDLKRRAETAIEQAMTHRERRAETAIEQAATRRERQRALKAREDRKVPMSCGAIFVLIVVGIFWLVLLAVGLGYLRQGLNAASEARRIASYPVLVGPGLEAMAPGEHAVVVGVLEGNAVLEYELVAFAREQWDVREGRDSASGSWHDFETNVPGLAISVDGDIVHTVRRDSGVRMQGIRHEVIYQRGNGWVVDDIADGSLRAIGFKNGDLVTLVGEKDANGSLIPEILYGGEPAQLLDESRSDSKSGTLVGGCILVALIPFTWLAVRLYTGLADGSIEVSWKGGEWDWY